MELEEKTRDRLLSENSTNKGVMLLFWTSGKKYGRVRITGGKLTEGVNSQEAITAEQELQ